MNFVVHKYERIERPRACYPNLTIVVNVKKLQIQNSLELKMTSYNLS